MNYNYTLTFGLGGLSLVKRIVIAGVILLVLKTMDKSNPEYSKALKTLAIGGILCLLLGALLRGLFAGLMGLAFALPFYW